MKVVIALLISFFAGDVLVNLLFFPAKFTVIFVGATLLLSLFLFRNRTWIFVFCYSLALPLIMGYRIYLQPERTLDKFPFLFQVYLTDAILFFLFIAGFLRKYTAGAKGGSATICGSKSFLFLLAMCAAGFLSVVSAVDKVGAGFEAVNLLRIALTFLCFYYIVSDITDFTLISKAFAFSLLAQSVLVVIQYLANAPLISVPGVHAGEDIVGEIFRPSGTMGHSGDFAKFAGMILPISFVLLISGEKKFRLFYLLCWLCGGLALFLTVSRIGISTFFLSILILFYLVFRLSRQRFRYLVFFSSLVILLLALILPLGADRVRTRIGNDFNSALIRLPMADVALSVIAHNPLGVGLNNYCLVHQDYDRTRQKISYKMPDSPVHNLFLLYAAEIGLAGFFFFIGFILNSLADLRRLAQGQADKLQQLLPFAFMVGVVNLLVQSLTGMGAARSPVHLSLIAAAAGSAAKLIRISLDKR